jgi:hypothetical protein
MAPATFPTHNLQIGVRATQERGASAPRGYATVTAMMFPGTPATVSRTFAVSPLQMRFRTPRRADARRYCLQARTFAAEMATFAMHKRMYNQERGTLAPRGWVTRTVCRMDRAPFSDMRPTTKCGGRQLPWLGDRNFDDVHRRTADGLVHVCGIALANAFPHTTAGSRPPLLYRATVCRRTCGWYPITHTSAGPTAG